MNAAPLPMNQVAVGTSHNQQQSTGTLWILVAAAMFGVGHLATTASSFVYDPVFITTAIPFVVIALMIVVLTAKSARRAGRPWQPERAAAIGILGVLTAVGVSICVTMVVVIALFFAFVITCGQAGRLSS